MDTGSRPPLSAFDDGVIRRVARERELDEARLRDVLRAHQEGVRSLPGVDDIVYEWRRTLPRDPLLERRPDVYLLAVEDAVWEEFLDALDCPPGEGDALRAVHHEQAVEHLGGERVPTGGRSAFVLTRP
ncbi:hypothetical protein [Halogeometricum limi]|uniref:DUF8048 domain-containing protein n=1 Tax=Halogeometricum limi TaxID=555875 RepID=A0A1I6GPF3_9EURY|nr:hypothetical protein [Halogeometricum limi]SFR43999.1 hypothetical protein SAMN04488124_1347 [Halogeometricum limi]